MFRIDVMMFRILTVVCLATSSLAQICCTPKQWEATETVVEFDHHEQHSATKSIRLVSYDAENNRTSMTLNVTTMSGEEKRLHVITDYVAMKRYDIHLDDESCNSEDLHGEFKPRCIKDDDTLLSEGELGIGDNTLRTSTYQENDYSDHSEITVTEECIPVIQSKVSGMFKKKFESTLYTDVTAGIVDINIFTPPSDCDEKTPMMEILLKGGRFDKV